MLPNKIETLIQLIRGHRVILDSDLANIYGVSTKRLNEQVKRNQRRFPADFAFYLTRKEKNEVVANCDHLKTLKFSPYLPMVFTEHGALMAANILNSRRAIAMSVYVIRVFVRIRETVLWNEVIEKRFSSIEKVLLDHDETLRKLLMQIKPLLMPGPEKTKKRIGFHSSYAPQFAIH